MSNYTKSTDFASKDALTFFEFAFFHLFKKFSSICFCLFRDIRIKFWFELTSF